MIDAKRLLADLKRLRTRIEADLRAHHATSLGRATTQAEWDAARAAHRTTDTFETFWTVSLDQAAVHWLLALVFLRFLEDNHLVDRPFLAGAGERGELAAERQRAHFRATPHDSDAEYLLATLAEATALPGLSGLFDPEHNPLFRLPVSGDMAMALFDFLRARGEDGGLAHNFTDPAWNTRFLGDLYQDLSEDARKRYALLQTPDFIEAWILDRTLDPAVGEFGFEHVRMIDPACGSGHFLLGGFARLLALWQRHEPATPPAALAQRALDAVAGVDLNPFAVEIARFRLLLAALHAAGITRLAAAPDFRVHVAVGDSLLHGRHFFCGELAVGGRQVRGHAYGAEDLAAVEAILGRQYHAVVGNPPYINPPDPAMRDAYRKIYASCYRGYGLGAPFVERFFDLAQRGLSGQAAGFVGLIVANNFMKREFGSRLIERVLAGLDLTHVVDCSQAHIPGHGTPTIILFGRNRAPLETVIRTVRGVRGETGTPGDPAKGLVWTSIVAQTDVCPSDGRFVSVDDTDREVMSRHPWAMGSRSVIATKVALERGAVARLSEKVTSIGFYQDTHADEAFVQPTHFFLRQKYNCGVRKQVRGDDCRDWAAQGNESILFPFHNDLKQWSHIPDLQEFRWVWSLRTVLWDRSTFDGRTYKEAGRPWFDYHQFPKARAKIPLSIALAFVSTHNHFVFDRDDTVFNRSAPVVKLRPDASERDYLALIGLLNSSSGGFWIRESCHNKGGQGINEGAKAEAWEKFLEVTSTRLSAFPLACDPPFDLAQALDEQARFLSSYLPGAICAQSTPTGLILSAARAEAERARATMIALQEELDWRCYRLYGLLDNAPEHPDPPPLQRGERAFEIVMARRMAEGTLETAWFTRHRSTPITALPAHWPADYRAIVERRIELIETDLSIGLIERPEYKRRWAAPTWEDQQHDALRLWLLDRLEQPHYWPREQPAVQTTRTLADLAWRDPDFCAVAAIYTEPATVNLDALVATLVQREAVPFLAALRYSATGLRKRADWEATWDKQRQEDAIDAEVEAGRPALRARAAADGLDGEALAARAGALVAAEQKRRKAEEIGAIPVPPKYKMPDFQQTDYWRLRGGLDVPKERFVSFPSAAPDADGTLAVLWAGHLHLPRAQALATLIVERREQDGWPAPRIAPLLAGLLELVPWLLQWHNDLDQDSGLRMGDYYADFVAIQARELGLTLDDLRGWTPPAPTRRTRRSAAA